MRSPRYYATAVGAGVGLVAPLCASADLIQVQSQARSTAASVVTTPAITGQTNTTVMNQSSQSVATAGGFANTSPVTMNLSYPTGSAAPFDFAGFNGSSTAIQNTNVSNAGLTGSGSVYASSQETFGEGQVESMASSTFTAIFTVPTATSVLFTGDVNGHQAYHLGWLEQITDTITLTGSVSGVVESVAYFDTDVTSTNFNLDKPFSLTTTLNPGETYTLAVTATSDSKRGDTGVSSYAPGTANYSFSLAAVPEPASGGLLGFGLLALRRARRKTSMT